MRPIIAIIIKKNITPITIRTLKIKFLKNKLLDVNKISLFIHTYHHSSVSASITTVCACSCCRIDIGIYFYLRKKIINSNFPINKSNKKKFYEN